MHRFPKDKTKRKIWTEKVRRANWNPSEYSRLCSDHFDSNSFVVPPQMALSIGYDLKLVRLKSDAVPTIFQRVKSPVKRKRSSTALEKRRRIEVHTRRGRVFRHTSISPFAL